jgi:hypothetical protein
MRQGVVDSCIVSSILWVILLLSYRSLRELELLPHSSFGRRIFILGAIMGSWVPRGLHVSPSSKVEKECRRARAARSRGGADRSRGGADRSRGGADGSRAGAEREQTGAEAEQGRARESRRGAGGMIRALAGEQERREVSQQNITWHLHLGVYI